MEKLHDLIISGMSKMNGGKFDNVEVSGLGKIFGDVEATKISISGSGNIEGSVKAKSIKIEGNGGIKGNLEAEELDVEGNFKIGGQLKTTTLETEGRCRIDGSVKAEKIFSEGLLSVGGGIEADEFKSEGAFKIDGLLNANKIEIKIKLGMGSRVKEIGGEEIIVKNKIHKPFGFFMILVGKSRTLKTDLIEGTNISLENTEAKTVRGSNIKIGEKCFIEHLEYSGTLEIDPGAIVKSQIKV